MTITLKNYNFVESEKKWQDYWQELGVYKWDAKESKENTFIVDTPPPTVSGQLHIGHVYSYTQADFIVRFQRMMGKNIFYPIGFDDNGLPTERLVEKQKGIRAANLNRQEFIDICKGVVESEEEKFRNLFNHMALSVDWSLEYQTISPLSCKISQMSFLDLINKNEIYRDDQPMLWDPIDQTALAQADIEDKERAGLMNDIIFQTINGEKLAIATTRPELLPACVSIFYHPEDERYKHLKGARATTPLFNVEVPLLPDDLVQPDKGTGLVMCCTFGDQTDILWWKKYKLPIKVILDKRGRITLGDQGFTDAAAEYANLLEGLKVSDARARIVEILKENELLLKQTEITQTVKCAERSGSPLEILTTPQWFVRTISHKQALLEKTQKLNWHPKTMKIRLENWINSIAWDWCISRQRFFGVPFPVWYSKRTGEEGKPLFAQVDQLPVDPLKDLPVGYARDEVEADKDVMDTWATSSVSPQLSSQGISDEFAHDSMRHAQLFPADLRPQAHEIIRTWAFYTMLKAHLHDNKLPWKNIMISGWCLAEDRSKMSKSKGNVVVPQKLLEQYGADVTRYWAATSRLGADTAYSEDVMKDGKRLVNKLWNASKFASLHFNILSSADKAAKLSEIQHKILRTIDLWLIQHLNTLVKKVTETMTVFEYAQGLELTEQFFMKNFCDNYLEITKTRAYNENQNDVDGQYSTVLAMYHSLQVILKLFAPFMPHITEEIYQHLYNNDSIHTRGNWSALETSADIDISQGAQLIEILDFVRKSKADRNISIKAPISVIEIKNLKLSDEVIEDLKNVTSAANIKVVSDFSESGDKFQIQNFAVNIVYL